MNFLPAQWQTERLVVSDGKLTEVAELRDVFNSCHYVVKWDPTFVLVPMDEVHEVVVKSGGPADGETQFRLQAARVQGEEKIIGYFHLYQRQPRPELAFISMMVMRPDVQGAGYGSELMAGLWPQLQALGWCQRVWLHVYLKNWPALRFWVSQGFDKVIRLEGDKVHDETTQALVMLEKRL